MVGLKRFRSLLAGGVCAMALAGAAAAQTHDFSVPAGELQPALDAYARQANVQLLYRVDDLKGVSTHGVQGPLPVDVALAQILDGTKLGVRRSTTGALAIVSAADPQGAGAGGGAETNVVQELIVTAQKKEEAIQTVPIAISAFTQKSLEEQHIEGGFDLLKAIPNVTFSKNNFTSYNFSIRGIGTKAVSATTDPGVAVSFNNIALLQNRLFEQEYFDVERVEVLRGPQGTLYGRNATAGVINVISAKPDMSEFKGSIKAEVGNYDARRASAMINLPLIDNKLAIRFAGSFTDRQGYDYNSVTQHHINGRDLWSGRVTVAFNPTEKIRTSLVWEHFNEDDNRSRTGKQLCHHDSGPSMIGSTPLFIPNTDDPSRDAYSSVMRPALFSQGCKPGSLYNDDAFGTPNGLALPFVYGMLALGGFCGYSCFQLYPLGVDAQGRSQSLVAVKDPYGGMMQSRDLRTIASFKDPVYRAKADVVEFNFDIDISDGLTLSSQTAYNKDSTYSFQDFNRFNTLPIFTDTTQLTTAVGGPPSPWADLAPGGVFCDPQLGCSNTLAGFDIAQGKGEQFTQEIRLQSNFSGPINFSVGADYTRFHTLIDYYVFYNLITAYALMPPFYFPANGHIDITTCPASGFTGDGPAVSAGDPSAICPYIDPNPIDSINGDGHNYFRSKNPYKLSSAAVFGEVYWQATEVLKVTAGLRYNDDHKTFIPVPSQILLAYGFAAGGEVSGGYPELPAIKQHWGEVTGRLGVDWKPKLSFTDQTMLYAFYSRGYKGGGANPPTPGFATVEETAATLRSLGVPQETIDANIQIGLIPILRLTGVDYGPTFEPEFVNAFEVGAKNTLLGGSLVLNGDAFFYDYKDYQVSQIKDRTAVNENFDAHIWGLEFESTFAPSRNLRIIANLGYLDTSIADGETSIDIMDRTQGDPNYIVVKPWVQLPSNCVVPVKIAEIWANRNGLYYGMCGGVGGFIGRGVIFKPLIDPATGKAYTPLATGPDGKLLYPEINGGAGIVAQLGGNELPNSPHWTMNIGTQYSVDFLESWKATVRADAYWQSQSWARVYNEDPYDKLHGWYNVNLSLWVEKPDIGLKIEIYAKNLLDKTPITDSFLNSDDTALTTNVFVLDPRLIGFSITKTF